MSVYNFLDLFVTNSLRYRVIRVNDFGEVEHIGGGFTSDLSILDFPYKRDEAHRLYDNLCVEQSRIDHNPYYDTLVVFAS